MLLPLEQFVELHKLNCTWWSSGRVLPWCVGGRGFNSRLGHTKNFKNGTLCFLATCSVLDQGDMVNFPVDNCKM